MFNYIHTLSVVVLSAASLSMIGCGGSNPAVSGTVTFDGEPVANLRVVFTPSPVGDNGNPGPWSKGVTDDAGVYSLKTRHGDIGAVAGPHKVGFEWADTAVDAIPRLRSQLVDADSARQAEINQQIEEIRQKMKSRPQFRGNLVLEFEVPAAGTSSADFDLTP